MTKEFDEFLSTLPDKGKKKRKVNKETGLQREIVQAIQSFGLWVVRVAGQGTMQHIGPGQAVLKKSEMAGFPDLLVLGPEGLTAWLEVKTPGGRLSPIQRARHERLQALTHVVATVHSAEEAIAVLRADGWFEPSIPFVYVTPDEAI